MAETLHSSKIIPDERAVILGKQLLDLVAAGMYSNPLMVIREYVQNATDSLDQAVSSGKIAEHDARIDVAVDGKTRTISIEDNGMGVPGSTVQRTLLSIGASQKNRIANRGFRGIGRLGGLGYCDKLVFETRSSEQEPVVMISWDAKAINDLLSRKDIIGAKEVIAKAVQIKTETLENTPSHFFRVRLVNVQRFHQEPLMDNQKLRNYLSQTSPVAYDKSNFSLAEEIVDHLSAVPGFKQYCITLNNEPIYRPYHNRFKVLQASGDSIRSAELFEIRGYDDALIGKGWYAKTSLLASLPTTNPMRGIRVRQGNIEVGDEYFLADHYSERRFATWHIGEIHLAPTIKPNARRDGFEPGPEYERFLEYASSLGKYLSRLCRESSSQRSSFLNLDRKIKSIQNILSDSIVFDQEHFETLCNKINMNLISIEKLIRSIGSSNGIENELFQLKADFADFKNKPPFLADRLDGRILRHQSGKDILCEICKRLIADQAGSHPLEKRLSSILEPYLRTAYKK
jgi:molecular chaperone HtpG